MLTKAGECYIMGASPSKNDGVKPRFHAGLETLIPAHVEMMGLIGAGNNPMVGMTVACAVSIEEASK